MSLPFIESIRWEQYLARLPVKYKDKVRMMWNNIGSEIPNIRIPHAEVSDDETTFTFLWADDVNHLEVDFLLGDNPDIEWFYINSMTFEIDGSSAPSSYLMDELLAMLGYAGVAPETEDE